MNREPARSEERWPENHTPHEDGDGDAQYNAIDPVTGVNRDELEGVNDLGDEVPLDTEASAIIDDDIVDDLEPPEENPAYFAPVDPVVTQDQRGDTQVLNGWAPSALSPVERPARSAEGPQPGDEALADAVRSELREDALTTDMDIEVEVEDGVVRLHGQVTDLEDAENAEAVASRVPGVRYVQDDLEVRTMERPEMDEGE